MLPPYRSLLVQSCVLITGITCANTICVVTTPSANVDYLGLHAYILEDPSTTYDITDAIRACNFKKAGQKVPNLGNSFSAFWLKLNIRNNSKDQSLLLTVPHPEIDELDVYLSYEGAVIHLASTGQSRPIKARIDGHREFAFTIPIASGSSGTAFIRVRSTKQLQVPIQVTTESRYHQTRAGRNLAIGAYVGIMLVMALYNLFIFISIRDRSYLVYVLYILSVTLTQLTFLGIGQFDLWPDLPWWSQRASIVLTMVTALAASEFMRPFLETKKHVSTLDRWTPAFYIFLISSAIIYALINPMIGYQLSQLGAGVFATWMLYIAIKRRRQGSRQAGFFLLAWSVFLTGVVIYVLKDMGILPYTSLTIYTMPVGSAIEGVLLSFGLADRINILRREKEASQAEALASSLENERIIREQNSMLESKVMERTHALQESNENLKQTQTQLVNAEKMASLGQLTAGIAHEINNPINFITSNVAPLRRNIAEIVEVIKGYQGVEAEHAAEQLAALHERSERIGLEESISELDDIIASIAEGSSRTAEIVRGLRNFSRLDEGDLKEADLNEGLRSTLTVLGPQYRDKVDFTLELGDIPKVECFPGKVNQVLMNILTNAVQATIARKDLKERTVRVSTAADAEFVTIRIADNGIGMNDAVKARVFEPFFTTKSVGEGTGLGMAIVYGIINDHGGTIAIDSMPGAGTEFTITLPLRQVSRLQKSA